MTKRITFLFALITSLSTSLFAQNQFRAILQAKNYTQPFQVCKDEPVVLEAFPKNDTLTYDWYRNGQLLFSSTSEKLTIKEGGFYKVAIKAKNYQSESEEVMIEQCQPAMPVVNKNNTSNSTLAVYPTISSTNPVICGSNTSAVLQASPDNAAYIYQWYYCATQYGSYTSISGATSSSYTTTVLGYYKVTASDGTPPNISSSFRVSNTPQATISDINGNLWTDIALSGGSAQLKITMLGGAPYTFTYSDGSQDRTVTTSTNPYILTVSPNQNRTYRLNSISNSCGYGSISGSNRVLVDASTAITPTSPTNLNVCAGSTISLPYTTTGTWQTERSVSVEMEVAATGSYINNSYQFEFSKNPIEYTLPSSLTLNTNYKVRFYSDLPSLNNSVLSSYQLTVTSLGCSPIATIRGQNVACAFTQLTAYPNSNGHTFQWYKDNVVIVGATNAYYTVTQTGNYKVNIINSSTSFNSTSTETPVSITAVQPLITSPNSVICGSNTSATLNSSITTGTFQWYKFNQSTYNFDAISGATSATYSATSIGEYRVTSFGTTCDVQSNSFEVTNTPTATLTNTSNNTNPIDINVGGTATLKVNFTGFSPWNFSLWDGLSSKYYTTTTSPFTININPSQSRSYYINNLNNTCGAGNSSNSLIVNVLPTPTFTLPTPSITTVCQGSSINIPYTIAGTWGAERKVDIYMIDNVTGYSINGSFQYSNNFNPIIYYIPSTIPVGTYKVIVRSYLPYINQSVTSAYTISVTAIGGATCTAPVASLISDLNSCTQTELRAYPRGTGYTYQWYKDGVVLNNGYTGNYNYVSSSGNYSVVVSNTSTGYSSTSADVAVSSSGISSSVFNQNGANLCTSGSSIVLESNNTNAAFTYQWYHSPNGNFYTPVSGATARTHTATLPGVYYVIIKNGTCDVQSNTFQTCPVLLTNKSETACVNSAVNIPLRINNMNNGSLLTLQLLDATSGAVVNPNLSSFTFDYNIYSFNFSLPNTVTAGTYKFRVTSSSPAITSPISEGVLTVLSSTAGVGPVLTASPTSFSSLYTYINFASSGCSGTVQWQWNGSNAYTGSTYSTSLNQTSTISAFCVGTAGGCTSMPSQITVNYSCTDAFEPNNSPATATAIASNTYTSPTICLDGVANEDWFAWVYSGKTYYIKTKLYSVYSNAGLYKIQLSLAGNVLTAETIAATSGQSLEAQIFLYDSDGTTLILSNIGANGNGFSKITYTLPNPCPAVRNLVSPTNDIAAGQTSTIKGVAITATNKVANTAIVDYRGENTITLNPGFETQISSGGTFKAQVKGCSDSSN